MRDTLSTFLAGELNKGFHGRGAREGDAREPVALETGMSDFAWLGSDLQRYVGSLRLDLIRGLIGRKIREQEDLIGVTTECVCVCVKVSSGF